MFALSGIVALVIFGHCNDCAMPNMVMPSVR